MAERHSDEPANAPLSTAATHLDAVGALMHRLAEEQGGEPLGRIVRGHLDTGGKRLRARLALAAVDALGGEVAAAVGWAAACELFHNATLVHDDLQDGDRMRRGQVTVWAKHGMPQAVNAGDLLFLLPFLAIEKVDTDSSVRWQLSRALASKGSAVIRGQSAELEMSREAATERERYVETVTGKTSGLFELPVEGAALLCGRDPKTAAALAAVFRGVGILFQRQDDLLDLYGEKGRETPGADLREGKVSTLVVEHLALHPSDRDWLLALLGSPREQTPESDVATAIERFRSGGALAVVCRQIRIESDEIRSDSALESEPRLRELAGDLIDLVLAPIAAVLAEVEEG